MKRSYNSVSIYDKNDNLVSYTEFADYLDTPKCYYNVNGNVLNRVHVNEDHNTEQGPIYETITSVIEYSNNVMLHPLVLDGETMINAVCSGNTINYNNRPEISNRFDTYHNATTNCTDIESFGVKDNLINEYVNKL